MTARDTPAGNGPATPAVPGPDRTAAPQGTPAAGTTAAEPSPGATAPQRAPEPATEAIPRAGASRATSPDAPGPGWGTNRPAPEEPTPTTVLPGGGAARRPVPPRPAARPEGRPAAGTTRPAAPRARRARLALRRIDPWSVFVFSLIASVFLGIALVVAVAVLYAVLSSLGVTGSLNQLFAEVTGGSAATEPLLTGGRIIGGATVLAAVNIVLLTLLATLGSLLYNLCASFTGGLELTLGDRD